jgi:hypothetical protein
LKSNNFFWSKSFCTFIYLPSLGSMGPCCLYLRIMELILQHWPRSDKGFHHPWGFNHQKKVLIDFSTCNSARWLNCFNIWFNEWYRKKCSWACYSIARQLVSSVTVSIL